MTDPTGTTLDLGPQTAVLAASPPASPTTGWRARRPAPATPCGTCWAI
ncbi:hypothetical protein SGLAM104S_01319 [Streptomyces glaucescens]